MRFPEAGMAGTHNSGFYLFDRHEGNFDMPALGEGLAFQRILCYHVLGAALLNHTWGGAAP